jgi:hypothetical protein
MQALGDFACLAVNFSPEMLSLVGSFRTKMV